MAYYVYSTLTNSQAYSAFGDPVERGIKPVIGRVVIEGGANLTNKLLVTPRGMVTPVTDAQMKILKASPMFNRHLKAGYIHVEEKRVKAEKVAGDMQTDYASSPISDKESVNKKGPRSKTLIKAAGMGEIVTNMAG